MIAVGGMRALFRIARRNVRRNPWRNLLVVALIALPVLGLTFAQIVVATTTPTSEELATGIIGDADGAVLGLIPGEATMSLLPEETRTVVRTTWETQTAVGGRNALVVVTDVLPDDPILGSMYELLEGRSPASPDEIAVAPSVLEQFDVNIGERMEIGDDRLSFRVVGIAVYREGLSEPVGLVQPGALSEVVDARPTGVFVQFGEGATEAVRNRTIEILGSDRYVARWVFALPPPDSNMTGMQFAVTAVVLMAVGLIVGAAFEVSIRRQLRMFGLLGATGGEPRHVFSLTVAIGVVLGFLGAALGVLAGSLAAMGVNPYLDGIVGRLPGPLEFPILGIVGGAVLGTLAATLSAVRPARTAARISTINALAGRTPRPRPVARLARIGAAATTLGAVLTGVGTVRGGATLPTIGLIAIVGGALALIPMLVSWVGRVATRLPLSLRIAARDTSRYGRRTGGAVAAAAIALAVPIASAAVMLTDDAVNNASPAMAENHLIIDLSSSEGAAAGKDHPLVRELLDEVFPDASVAGIVAAAYDPGQYSLPGEEVGSRFEYRANFLVAGELRSDGSETVQSGAVYIGDAELLRALGAEQSISDLEGGFAVAFSPDFVDGDVTYLQQPDAEFTYLNDPGERWLGGRAIPAVVAVSPVYGRQLPTMVVSTETAAELGLVPTALPEILLAADSPVSSDQMKAARTITARYAGASILGLEDTRLNTSLLRVAVVVASGVLALAIVGVALGLVAAESRRDQAIMDAVGAGPWTRRKIVGSSALVVTVLAAIPAVLIGFLPVSIYHALTTPALPVVVPWRTMAAVVFVIPMAAGVIAFAVTGRPPTTYLRRAPT